MDNSHMNRSLGTKWFTFYTKVRPWLACLGTITVVSDFFKYMDVYKSYWWLMLYFAASIAQAVLCIMVFVKSRGDYIDFVRFVKKILLFETIAVSYGQGVQQYIKNGFDFNIAIVVALVVFLGAFFIWYRLNLKYFNKRIINATDTFTDKIYAPQEDNRVSYCSNCGNKMDEGSKFCSKCGSAMIV